MARGSKPHPFDERLERILAGFWRYVERSDDPDACWAWTGPTLRTNRPWQRYGSFNVWRGVARGGSKNYRAHRFAWMLLNGPIPEGMNVLHRCDNSNCVNPAHLFLGTQQENVEDQREKGRLWYGVRNGRSKLTEQDVLDIRASDEPDSVLGERYDVHPTTIYMARVGRKWPHLPGARTDWKSHRTGHREG